MASGEHLHYVRRPCSRVPGSWKQRHEPGRIANQADWPIDRERRGPDFSSIFFSLAVKVGKPWPCPGDVGLVKIRAGREKSTHLRVVTVTSPESPQLATVSFIVCDCRPAVGKPEICVPLLFYAAAVVSAVPSSPRGV
jgi:hypothetical protein